MIGIGAALLLFYALNKIAELLPEKWEERIKPLLYILPAFLAIVVYLVYPAILTFINSFKDRSSTEWVGLQNFEDLLTDPGFQDTIFNTLLWIIVVPAACVILGLAVATLADRLGPRGEKTLEDHHLPADGDQHGRRGDDLAVRLLRRPGGSAADRSAERHARRLRHRPGGLAAAEPVPLQQLPADGGAALVAGRLLDGAALRRGQGRARWTPLEAARIDGASERQIFFKVVVPQIKGTIITVYITVLIGVMKVFDIVYVMTNGNFNTNVLGNEFWNQLSTNFNNGAAAAIVVILMIAVIPIMWLPGAPLQGRGGQRMTFPATTVIDDTPKVARAQGPRPAARATPPRPAGEPRSSSRRSACCGWCRSSAPS